MNTPIPFPSLRKPGVRDPLACIRTFLGKCRALALKRADHGSVLEHNVMGRFIAAEGELRDAGAKSVELIARKIGALQEYQRGAFADGVLTAAEDKALREQLATLYGQLVTLSNDLKAPALTA